MLGTSQITIRPKKRKFLDESGSFESPAAKRRRMEIDKRVIAVSKRRADKRVVIRGTASTANNTGTMLDLLVNLGKGDEMLDDFSGSFIDPVNIRIRYSCGIGVEKENSIWRVIVFQWFDSTVPTAADLFDTAASFAAGVLAPYADKDQQVARTTKILYDRFFVIDKLAANTMYDTIYIPGKKLKRVHFTATGATVKSGGLYLLFLTESAVANHHPFAQGSSVMYTDE